MKIRYSKAAIKYLQKLDKKSVCRIRDGIQKLTLNPPEGDTKKMVGYSDGRMRLRVGEWRVIYRYENDSEIEILMIIDIGNRGDIYK